MEYNLLIHRREDHAGVAVSDIKAGGKIKGLVLLDGSCLEADAEDVPLAHKMAVKAASPGQEIILYGHTAGRASRKWLSATWPRSGRLSSKGPWKAPRPRPAKACGS